MKILIYYFLLYLLFINNIILYIKLDFTINIKYKKY